MLKLEPDGVKTKDDKGRSLMWYYASDPCVLLSLLKKGADPHVPEMPDILVKLLRTKNSDNDVVLEVLSKFLAMGVKFEDYDGNCLTKLYMRKPLLIRQLISMGAKVNASFFKMLLNNKNFCIIIPVLTNLLAAGADLFVVDDNGCSVVCYATTRYMLKPSTDTLNLLYFLLKLPVFSDFTPKCKPGYLPHDIVLNNCLCISLTELKDVFNIIFKSQLKNYKYTKNMTFTLKDVECEDMYFTSSNLSFVTAFILLCYKIILKIETHSTSVILFQIDGNRCENSETYSEVKILEHLVVFLLKIGLGLNDGDSSLPIFMALQLKYNKYYELFYSFQKFHFQQFFDKMVVAASTDAGCSSQCKTLEVLKKNHIHVQENLDSFQISDVLYLASIKGKSSYILILYYSINMGPLK
jgi:hypothetical protein